MNEEVLTCRGRENTNTDYQGTTEEVEGAHFRICYRRKNGRRNNQEEDVEGRSWITYPLKSRVKIFHSLRGEFHSILTLVE